ncbi:MAG TPA: IclR family transcriptional regulator [Streptosporangiaceae bacterium]|nr:IclR family transcriptional regulator [Streptosporangiaceae bacterium]
MEPHDSSSEVAGAWLQPGSGGGGENASRYTVRSVARAMRLMEIVAEGPSAGQTLSDLARALGASKSTTLALARTLGAHGLLRDARPGPRYTLGTALIRLGDIARGQLPLGDLCRPLLSELASMTKMTSRVAICDDGYPVFIERVDGPGSVRFYTPLGQREIPYASAAGKAMLATMTDAQVRAMCEQTGLKARTAHTITDIDSLLANLDLARGNGFAVDDEEDAEGIFCVGAAFFGHDGACAGAVSITGIKGDLPTWRVKELGRAVRRYADQVSEILGGVRYSERDRAIGAGA